MMKKTAHEGEHHANGMIGHFAGAVTGQAADDLAARRPGPEIDIVVAGTCPHQDPGRACLLRHGGIELHTVIADDRARASPDFRRYRLGICFAANDKIIGRRKLPLLVVPVREHGIRNQNRHHFSSRATERGGSSAGRHRNGA